LANANFDGFMGCNDTFLSRIIPEIKRDIRRKSRFFMLPCFRRLGQRVPVGILLRFGAEKKLEWRGIPDGDKSLRIRLAVSSFNTIPACDGQTDGRTDEHPAALYYRHIKPQSNGP